MQTVVSWRQRFPTSESPWRAQVGVTWAACALLVLTGFGCGESAKPAVPSKTVSRKILHLEQGVSIDQVKRQLGEPDLESSVGTSDELSYGSWQLAFVEGRLETRSKVVIPKRSRSEGKSEVSSRVIRGLKLGSGVEEVQAILGAPEAIYLTYEGRAQPVRVLRYGPWELTFVGGSLTQRAQ